MSSTKVTELTAASSLVANDLLMVIKDTSSTPVNKKITISDVANSMLSSVNNNIIPAANNTTNLGSAAKSFNTAYVSSNGIIVNGTRITIDNTGTLTVNGAQIISSANVQLANNATYAYGKTENNLNVNSAVYAATVNNATFAYGKNENQLNVNNAVTSNTANTATYLGGKLESALNVNSAITSNTANNSTFVNGKAESGLNVNNALTSNSASFLGGKAEGGLNVNTALTSNNASYLNNKLEADLNVNSAVSSNTANNSSFLNNKAESALDVNTALTSNNTTYVNGKAESALNVNSAVTSNNSSFLGGKAEAGLNVNTALVSNNSLFLNSKAESALNVNSALVANNSGFLGGKAEAALNVNSALTSNNTTFVNGKAESALNVNSASTANNSSFLNSKAETALNVNSALTSNTSLTSNNSTFAYGKSESALNVNSALTANNSAFLNSKAESALNVNSALVSNNSSFAYGKTESNLNVNSALSSNNSSFLGGVAAASYAQLASPTFTGTVSVGDLVVANTITVTGSAFVINATALDIEDKNITIAKGSANASVANGAGFTVDGANALITYFSTSDEWNFNKTISVGNSSVNVTVNSTAFTGSANNSSFLNGKAEAGLNVNSAASSLTSNNSTFAFGKAESALNVNSALTSNNSSFLNSKSEGGLNVNNALTSNNSSFLNGKAEAALSVNTSLLANNSSYAFGKSEFQLNVNAAAVANDAGYLNGKIETGINANSALTANNSTYLNGKLEGALNVNSALTAYSKSESALNVNSALTSNNSSFLNGVAAASYVQNTDSRTLSGNITFTANVTLKGLIANGSIGATGQFLASNGSAVYWGSGAVGANDEIQFSFNNALTSDPEFTYNGDTLTVGNSAGPTFIARKGEMAVTNGDSWADFVSANNQRFWADPDYVELAKITSSNSDYIALSTVTVGDATIEVKTSNTNFAGYRGLEIHNFDIRRIGAGNVSIRFPDHTYSNTYTITLPSRAPANGEILISDVSGNLSWTSLSTLAGDTPYTWTNTHTYVHTGSNSTINSTAVTWLSNTTFNGLRITSTGTNFSGTGNASFTSNVYTTVNTTASQLASRYLTATANLETYSSSQTSISVVGASFTNSSSSRRSELVVNSTASVVSLGNSTVNTVISDTTASIGVNSTSTALFVAANGNVGVGNTTPVHRLRVAGDISLAGGVHANGSLGANGRVLMSNGTVAFWSDTANNSAFLGGSAAANYVQNTDSRTLSGNLVFSGANNTFSDKVTINGQLLANDVTISGNLVINGTTTSVNAVTLDVTDKNITVAKGSVSGAAADGAGLTVDGANALITYTNATDSWNFNKNIVVGNTSVNVTINSTSFTGTALTANLASYIIANTGLVSNSSGTFVNSTYIGTLSSNNTTFVNGKAESALNVNNALTANLASYIIANTGIVSNATGVFVNSAYIATISSNNTTFVNGKTEGNLNVNNALTSNLASYIIANTGIVSNATGVYVNSAYIATISANNTTFVNGKTESSLNVNNALTANLASYIVANSGIVSNATGVYVNTSYIATLSSNNTTFVNGKAESDLNVNSALTSNSATYLGSKLEAGLNVNNALTANSSSYLGSKQEADLNVNNALTSNSASYLGSKQEANLNVNNALTANSSTYLGSVAANGYMQTKYTVSAKTQDYTVVSGDTGTVITVANTTTANIEIPASLDVGYTLEIINLGSGNAVVTNAAGVSLLSKNAYTIAVGGKATIIVYAANSVSVTGDI